MPQRSIKTGEGRLEIKRYYGTFLLLASLAACQQSGTYVKNGHVTQTILQNPEQKDFYQTIGIGAADSALTNETQKKSTSREAALVQAQYEMLSIVKGVQLEGGITVQKAIETDSQLETHVKETIHGADIVKTEWTSDDGCVVTLRLIRHKLEDAVGRKIKE